MEQSLPTQQFVLIKEIRNGVVYLKTGGLRKILIVSGVNFDLKSEEEQTVILNSFQNFLNTLDFPVQFFIHSRKINIEKYLELINRRKNEEPNELLKIQIEDYINFVRAFVEQNPIINKSFFVVVPYDPIPTVTEAKGKGFLNILKGSTQKTKETKQETESSSVIQLNQRVEQVMNGLEIMGLRAFPLADEELTELFYNLYNPQLVEKQKVQIPDGGRKKS